MAGILVQVAVSWLLVWLFDRRNLSVLGLNPNNVRLRHFAIFFSVAAAFSTSGFLLKMWIAHQRWQLNPNLGADLILSGIWFTIKSVLFEELIFRGVLLYLLIKKIGSIKAIWISAISFGAFHWFSTGFENGVQWAVVFLLTGSMGLVLAYAYDKTKSLYVPVAIHLGWNIIQHVAFSNGPLGKQWLVEVLPQPEVTVSYFSAFLIFLFPMVGVLVVCAFLIRSIAPRQDGYSPV